MIHIIYIYLMFNCVLVGGYIFNKFNEENLFNNIINTIILFFFGVIITIYELITNKW